ncbi:MAG: hypothetical protein GF341_03140 [candidate division Zixibacteria bacterium]|nr:hypothetical protein [candidate division Zixibacteria bacterium]
MKRLKFCIAMLGLLLGTGLQASDGPAWTADQEDILASIRQLSATTAPEGGGPDAYAAMLADGFSRWTIGSTETDDADRWVAGIREWWADGWRVSDRKTEYLEIAVQGDYAFTRRIVTETYAGPRDEVSSSTTALSEVWIRGENNWQLLLVNVHSMDAG